MTTPVRHPNHPQAPSQQVACNVCHKEIPLSSALAPEGAEYFGYFCGIDCYNEFVATQEADVSEQFNRKV
jgi:Domain of unknown function (DUF3330)